MTEALQISNPNLMKLKVLAFFCNLFPRTPVPNTTPRTASEEDSWLEVGGFYVGRYRAEIEQIAKALCDEQNTFTARFNPGCQCGEVCVKYRRYYDRPFYNDVRYLGFEVQGCHGSANDVRILSVHQLDQKTKDLIIRTFEHTKLKIEFKHFL